MPALKRPERPATVKLPARKAPVIAESDVLVVGGGPAGIGAAAGAASAGAGVILIERYGFLGGTATAALVTCFMSFHTPNIERRESSEVAFYPRDHGPAEPVIAGVVEKFLNLLIKRGGAISPSMETGYVVSFDPEIFKNTAADLMNHYGVKFLYHAFASGVIGENKIEGVILETKSGPVVIKAGVVIDCTGDGDIAALAGAPYEIGRSEDGLCQPMTLLFRITRFDRDKFAEYVRKNPDQWNGVQGLKALIEKATVDGKLSLPREDILFFGTPHQEELNINSTRINRVSGVDVWDLTQAEHEGRQQVHQIDLFLREYVPGFGRTYIMQTGINVGVRESRRILGEYVITAGDILGAAKFDDVIARGTYPIDIHAPDGKGTTLMRLPKGESYDIPLRCLIPRKINNLLVAGRCISGTHEALASYRIIPISMATGQAAGVCAALSAKQNVVPSKIEYRAVQKELLRQGADLGKDS